MPYQSQRLSSRWLKSLRAIALASMVVLLGCLGDQPRLVFGPGVFGNQAPTLAILAPSVNLNLNQGEPFDIRWADDDIDSPALVSFSLLDTVSGVEIVLVSNIQENDNSGPDQFSASTGLIPLGIYNLLGRITDGFNEVVSVFAIAEGSSTQRVVITIGEPGTNPLNVPPQVAVIQPAFNQGVAQDDTLIVTVRPTTGPANPNDAYDADSESELFIVLDLNSIPSDDDPRLPDPNQIIVLRQQNIAQGASDELTFNIGVDLAVIPARPNGEPYRVRATIIDSGNQRVHAYAQGSISILRSATGTVDLIEVGRTLSGAKFQGFNPGSNLGSTMTGIGDFDADGIDDFMLVAQFGNPRNFGNIGEAYLIYGLNQARFGGVNNVNSVSRGISGVIFEAPPNRLQSLHNDPLGTPRGISSVASILDLTGDGRPDLLFGMPMADGLFQGRDDDPGDAVEPVEVNLTARFGFRTLTNNGTPAAEFDDNFEGVIDTFVDRTNPNTASGGDQLMLFGATSDQEEDQNQFPIIGFEFPDAIFTPLAEDISELDASITLTLQSNLAISTESFAVHRLNLLANDDTDFNDFNASDGTPGPTAMTDYDDEEVDYSVSFNVVGQSITTTMVIDITDVMQMAIDGEIGTRNPQFIIIPILPVNGTFFSSEAAVEPTRPLLSISFEEQRQVLLDTFNCYPDPYVNNRSTVANDPGTHLADATLESCGVVAMVASENRDLSGPSDGVRLANVVVPLELSGQETLQFVLSPGTLQPFVDPNPADGPITHTVAGTGSQQAKGSRIQAGWWEFINDGLTGQANPRTDFFGERVASVGDITLNGTPEIIISSPRNEAYIASIRAAPLGSADNKMFESTHFSGSIQVIDGADYSTSPLFNDGDGNQVIPARDRPGQGSCTTPIGRRGTFGPSDRFEVFAEDINDFLGGAEAAGDMNRDGVPDIICG
ncbi:MAG: hypothetical protein GXP29_05870, partial [Planctomycetes bacterium]|nr:hypothetical protein [Planctomycetota bacterium]